jgi:uncharacterized protein (TIGR02588 family)
MTVTSKNRHTEASQPHWLEWVTGIISALLILGMVGWIAGEAILQEETPPQFRAEVRNTTPVQDSFLMEVEIYNEGSATAAAVEVRGEAIEGEDVLEAAEATFDYIPGKSSAKGGLFFKEDPRGHTVEVRVIGFADP